MQGEKPVRNWWRLVQNVFNDYGVWSTRLHERALLRVKRSPGSMSARAHTAPTTHSSPTIHHEIPRLALPVTLWYGFTRKVAFSRVQGSVSHCIPDARFLDFAQKSNFATEPVGKAEPTKFEAEQPTKPTDCSVIFKPWQQTFPPQTIQGLL